MRKLKHKVKNQLTTKELEQNRLYGKRFYRKIGKGYRFI